MSISAVSSPAGSSPASSVSGSAASSAMVRPPTVTARASRRSRPPPHTGHGALVRKPSALARRAGLFESENVFSTYRRALVYVPRYGRWIRPASRTGWTVTTGCSSVNRIHSRCPAGSSRQGRSTSYPSASRTSRRFFPCQAPGHAAIAPSLIDREGSGTSSSSVVRCTRPSPWHSGHAPAAVFGEKASESSRSAPGG